MSKAETIRREITNQIIQSLESGQKPFWRRPWTTSKNAGNPGNFVSGKGYRGINVLLLGLHADRHDLKSRWWGTFPQWQSLGCLVKARPSHVDAGHWGCKIIFYRPVTKMHTDADTGEEHEEQFPVLRTYTVFNADQVEGEGASRFQVTENHDQTTVPDFAPADQLVDATGASIRIGGEKAFYRSPLPLNSFPKHTSGDEVYVPSRTRFASDGAWYETLFHELAHWSEVRLVWNRKDEGYAAGELVAELASVFVAGQLGIPTGEGLENHAAYLKHWLNGMKADSSFIMRASTQASKVADFLMSFHPDHAAQPATLVAA